MPSSVRLRIHRSLSMSTSKVGPNTGRPSRCSSVAVGLDVTQSGGVAVARHHRPQQLGGAGPAAHPGVLAGRVLALGLGGIELALAALGAEDRELDTDFA